MKWLNSLKIAIIERNITLIGKLITEVPKIKEIDKAQEALALINEAIFIVEEEKSKALVTMNKIKQTKAFLEAQ